MMQSHGMRNQFAARFVPRNLQYVGVGIARRVFVKGVAGIFCVRDESNMRQVDND